MANTILLHVMTYVFTLLTFSTPFMLATGELSVFQLASLAANVGYSSRPALEPLAFQRTVPAPSPSDSNSNLPSADASIFRPTAPGRSLGDSNSNPTLVEVSTLPGDGDSYSPSVEVSALWPTTPARSTGDGNSNPPLAKFSLTDSAPSPGAGHTVLLPSPELFRFTPEFQVMT